MVKEVTIRLVHYLILILSLQSLGIVSFTWSSQPKLVHSRHNQYLLRVGALSESSSVLEKSKVVETKTFDPSSKSELQESFLPSSLNETPALSLFGGTDNEYRRGLVTIFSITLLFASNSPVLHAAFSSGGSQPPVLFINAAVSCVALVGLLFGGSLLEDSTPLPSSYLQNEAKMEDDEKEELKLKAGVELGLWKFLGTTANLYGLSLTTAAHGAFLIQLTTLIVPVVQGMMGVPIPKRIQFSVALALAGVFLFTQDAAGTEAMGQNTYVGDALCVLAAGFYATYDLRLFQWGKLVAPRDLITGKIAAQSVFSVLLLLVFGFAESVEFLTNDAMMGSLLLLGPVVLWSGIAVNAVAPFLQVGGQQAVGPTRAQTLYASQPLWAAMMSYAWFGETVGVQGIVGGAAFMTALGLAATAEAPDPNCGQDSCEV